ncbi:MAG: bifunctional diaminohydroxyphosphoribosylaminopyrimidine deaminase/5-amino-6-(5-phosphoribosylamino)uracil reductase RibD [Cytophagaceae bacterium]|nr:bifunctional diaminohydroxyphosphoribosylaminopyrimidine deaminase/5-amino-6-(5-phosphoribosylamino)uracil reductase RibD [Cytophagaceae bacterium]MDW8456266.1 bifunctional diaminohydroxyphosphoribosylaminopyrimidine deaminase/5-amino-6-(5-phosphoribosylamino)uracil reductase RibD [Cytophagaceae bacterium]
MAEGVHSSDIEVNDSFMRRAHELALLGAGQVSPNPLVGCVIVKDGHIIGEGWHQRYGYAHAEVNAIESVKDKSMLKNAVVYVNLEPCAHTGKTPPCTDMLCKYPIRKVIISNIDPNPLVAGKGIEKLIQNGIEVETGILENEGAFLNRRFFTFIQHKRPYIILKWAETIDGYIAREDYTSRWISHPLSRKLAHKWRSEEDAVMVGTNTALFDNPRLNVRDWKGRNPVRIVLDLDLKIPAGAHILDGTSPTIVFNKKINEVRNLVQYISIDDSYDLIPQILEKLYSQNIQSVIVEGGAMLLNTFIKKQMWDEARIFRSNISFGKGLDAPVIKSSKIHKENLLNDELIVNYNTAFFMW